MIVMVAGTRSIRTRVASITTMIARATPICLIASMSPKTKPTNTATMIAAAEVMMRPERCSPRSTASSLASPASQYSFIRATRKTS